MPAYNQVILIGNLTRDPELRVTPKGTAICQLGIAINRKFKKEDGSTGEEVTFVDLEAWGKTGELIAKYLTKGSPAMFDGRLKFDQWDDKTTGKKMSKLKVVVNNVQFLGTKGDQQGGEPAPAQQERHAPPAQRSAPPAAGGIDEDVPF